MATFLDRAFQAPSLRSGRLSFGRLIALALLVWLLAGAGIETWRVIRFYADVSASRDALLGVRQDLQLQTIGASDDEIYQMKGNLTSAAMRLQSARDFMASDPLIAVGAHIPSVGKNAVGLRELVNAAFESTQAGLLASDILLAFNHSEDNNDGSTSIQSALGFLRSQEEAMAVFEASVARVQESRDRVPLGLLGPLGTARSNLNASLTKLSALVNGYNQADGLLPALLGYEGPKKYLVLPQNDTELFPSGGLISNYGIATFDKGRFTNVEFEYFTNLFDRWQKHSGGEYIAPPTALKNHLLGKQSWALGEAGWYPDFPTTANLATMFVQKGGAAPTDGTIAIDTQFVAALLDYLGPVTIPEYGVTVNATNLAEVTLEKTRGESATPGSVGKAFLSPLSRELLNRIFASPRDKWVGLLELFDRMGRERHLQMNFVDPKLQALSANYHLDGGVVDAPGDYLMVADASIQSTKLNLILQPSISLELQLGADGRAAVNLSYTVVNPFLDWKKGKDTAVVKALMIDGIYGSYLRLYAPPQAELRALRINGASVGPEQSGLESGRRVFGRSFPVGPGETKRVDFVYSTPDVVQDAGDGRFRYSLYVQKEAGTKATPFALNISLPPGAKLLSVSLDGVGGQGLNLQTDLRTDHRIEVEFQR